ncbi:major facilitator superfamily domain-containing protein [Lasiosphaeris hirsuta]|uniref:Major facilitator superfamily domain-containing protein n=1 Tax=Lasiosphaeris hirsuta TaxID=260670 RepID=A0AA40A3C5_9PEZI|nr:major facilitator superfamily domain-containing protein [Lasiosphaeris hirsuta]
MMSGKRTSSDVGKADNVELAYDGGTTHFTAERGHAATDMYVNALIHIDPILETKLRVNIDLMIIPTVALLYLFCFIDRANIGEHTARMIFVVEGVITVGLSIIGFFTLTDRPVTARWLTEAEKDMAIARVKAERVASTEVFDGMDRKKLLMGMTNPMTLFTSVIYCLNNVSVQGLTFFLPTVVRTIYPDYSIIMQQLYTVPPYVVGDFFCVLLPGVCTWFDRRQIVMMGCAPVVMVGFSIFLGMTNPTARYGAANVISGTSRASAIGLNVMMGNIGGMVSTWSFLPSDAPNYLIGNRLNLATAGTTLCVASAIFFWMRYDNKKRDLRNPEEELAGMSQQDIQDLEYKHPSWRWKP